MQESERFVCRACGSAVEAVYYKVRKHVGCPATCSGELVNTKVGFKCPNCKTYYPL